VGHNAILQQKKKGTGEKDALLLKRKRWGVVWIRGGVKNFPGYKGENRVQDMSALA